MEEHIGTIYSLFITAAINISKSKDEESSQILKDEIENLRNEMATEMSNIEGQISNIETEMSNMEFEYLYEEDLEKRKRELEENKKQLEENKSQLEDVKEIVDLILKGKCNPDRVTGRTELHILPTNIKEAIRIYERFPKSLLDEYPLTFTKINAKFIKEICKADDLPVEFLELIFLSAWKKGGPHSFEDMYLVKEILRKLDIISKFSRASLDTLIEFLETKLDEMYPEEVKNTNTLNPIITEADGVLYDENSESANATRSKKKIIKLCNTIKQRKNKKHSLLVGEDRENLYTYVNFFYQYPHLIDENVIECLKKLKEYDVIDKETLKLIDSINDENDKAINLQYKKEMKAWLDSIPGKLYEIKVQANGQEIKGSLTAPTRTKARNNLNSRREQERLSNVSEAYVLSGATPLTGKKPYEEYLKELKEITSDTPNF